MRQTGRRSSFGRYVRVLGIVDENAAAGPGYYGKEHLRFSSRKHFGYGSSLVFPSKWADSLQDFHATFSGQSWRPSFNLQAGAPAAMAA
jgi:hypothetical protein